MLITRRHNKQDKMDTLFFAIRSEVQMTLGSDATSWSECSAVFKRGFCVFLISA